MHAPLHPPFSCAAATHQLTPHALGSFSWDRIPAAVLPQVAELEGERQDMSGLLGGYQTSIQQLQDEHSSVVVRLQGENAALRAEVGWGRGGRRQGKQGVV